MRPLLAAIAFAAFASCGAGDSTGPAPVPAGSIRVTIGKDTVIAELVATLAEREKGLMGRTSLPDSAGMFFAFGSDQILQFWMKDTPIALSIAFMDADGKILNIEDMEPNTETVHRSAAPARYALEVRKGWFGARNILAGAKAVFTLPIGLSIDP